MTAYFIEFDYRSDGGPRWVGPFPDRDSAQAHAESHASPGWEAEFSLVLLTPPATDEPGEAK